MLQVDKRGVPVVLAAKVANVFELCDVSSERAQEDSKLFIVERSDSCHLELEGGGGVSHLAQHVGRKGLDLVSDLCIARNKQDLVGEDGKV